ncbi:putative CTL (choline transporter-like) family protein [Lyophyllum shimeji]|uniref:CTL (Choline transporter-like) family protein n=1 Tax=Lyophyllum shimeji TaxID=47721 RepID=A0A9P3PET2_LYOSH|nr:putative CTL (choline transporter-like) family protein [Lyophyllum shimeji]
MFFSFTTDDGSRAGHNQDTDLDDLDDPHLRDSEASRATYGRQGDAEDDDDPYLRLDEDERTGRAELGSRHYNPQSMPLIESEDDSLSPEESPKGWLAHLASPMMRHVRSRSRSPSPTPSESTDSGPPPDLYGPETIRMNPSPPPPPPSTSRAPVSLSLTESLLPRDGRSRPLDVFSLPDPRHTPRGRRKYNDSIWTAIWCAGVSICVVCAIILLFVTRKPGKGSPRVTLPYTTLLHTVPMLTILTFLSAFAAYTHIFLLRIFVRPVMLATSVFIPATLFISAVWAFVGSFMWDGDTGPTWGETVGLRLFSLVPLVLCLITARRLVHLPRELHVTSSTLTLTTELLINNPFLLALSPAILLITLIASIPFLTLIFRLLLIGYASRPHEGSSAWEWHVHGWANWAIAAAVAVWLWTWGVARGILRMTCASVIGAWYFADPDAQPPPPMSTHTIHAALTRSTGPSLGSIVLAALLLTIIRLLSLLTLFLHRLPGYIPPRALFLVSGIRMAAGYLETVSTALSKYALVYSGITGDPFMNSARRARALTSGVEAKVGRAVKKGYGVEPPLMLLTVAPLTLTFPFALTTYLFVAHTLDAPQQALGAAMLGGGVTALVGLFCVGLVQDTADTLYICYCIDKDMGLRRREEVFVTFEYDTRPQTRRSRQQTALPTRSQHQQSSQPPRKQQAPPQTQYMPSESTSRYLPRQPLLAPSPSPPHTHDHEDDVNPFERSYMEDNTALPPATAPAPGPPSRAVSPPQKMKTSAELNMKSRIESRPHSPDSPHDEEPADGSQRRSSTPISLLDLRSVDKACGSWKALAVLTIRPAIGPSVTRRQIAINKADTAPDIMLQYWYRPAQISHEASYHLPAWHRYDRSTCTLTFPSSATSSRKTRTPSPLVASALNNMLETLAILRDSGSARSISPSDADVRLAPAQQHPLLSKLAHTIAAEWQLWYFASPDPDVARTPGRAFFRSEGATWAQDVQKWMCVEGEKNNGDASQSGANVIVLAGNDQIIPAEQIGRYLTDLSDASARRVAARLGGLAAPPWYVRIARDRQFRTWINPNCTVRKHARGVLFAGRE